VRPLWKFRIDQAFFFFLLQQTRRAPPLNREETFLPFSSPLPCPWLPQEQLKNLFPPGPLTSSLNPPLPCPRSFPDAKPAGKDAKAYPGCSLPLLSFPSFLRSADSWAPRLGPPLLVFTPGRWLPHSRGDACRAPVVPPRKNPLPSYKHLFRKQKFVIPSPHFLLVLIAVSLSGPSECA